ncbi:MULTISPECIES: helix-turn-helix domain-containing protein [unclassified Clostridioides]|uniref:helix-turn-helix domain-containing protein n=1 Tax=unclassified Clostridioides TaxID=2635829 RepID=UPI001D0CD07C
MKLLRDIRERDWFWIENILIDREDLTIYEKMIYIVLARHSNEESFCFPSYKTISAKCGCSERQAKNVIKSLEEKGLIKKENRTRDNSNEKESNIYFILTAKVGCACDAQQVVNVMHNPSAPHAQQVVHEVHSNNTNINNTNISNNTQSKKSLKNNSNLYCATSTKSISRDDIPIAGDDRGVYHQVIGNNTNINNTNISNDGEVADSVKIPDGCSKNTVPHPIKISEPIQYKNGNKDYSIKDNIPLNKKTNNKPKTDYLDLSFLDLDIEKVKLTKDEYDKLINKFGKKYIHDKIVSLENYIVNGKGSRYKSHYRALLTWGNEDVSKGIVSEVTKAKNPLAGFKEL